LLLRLVLGWLLPVPGAKFLPAEPLEEAALVLRSLENEEESADSIAGAEDEGEDEEEDDGEGETDEEAVALTARRPKNCWMVGWLASFASLVFFFLFFIR
jgi:hypothetical protein